MLMTTKAPFFRIFLRQIGFWCRQMVHH